MSTQHFEAFVQDIRQSECAGRAQNPVDWHIPALQTTSDAGGGAIGSTNQQFQEPKLMNFANSSEHAKVWKACTEFLFMGIQSLDTQPFDPASAVPIVQSDVCVQLKSMILSKSLSRAAPAWAQVRLGE